MQANNPAFFNPSFNQNYKIVSVLDAKKSFTLQKDTKHLILQDFTGASNQLFHIYHNNSRYAFVELTDGVALHIQKQNPNDGGVISGDAGQFPSSYVEIASVTKGPWANKGVYLKTFSGKSFDIKGGKIVPDVEICQWSFHGNDNQIWLIQPAEPQQAEQVQAVFESSPNTLYKVVSVLDSNKGLTIDKTNKLSLHTYTGDASQKFFIGSEQNRHTFQSFANHWNLAVFQDKKDNGAEVLTDAGKHGSNLFELARASNGKWANKAYLIKTHAGNRGLDIAGGKAEEGKPVIQWDIHGNENQLWQIIAVQTVEPDVPANFVVAPNTLYQVVSVLDKTKALSVDQAGKIVVRTYNGEGNQKFSIEANNNKFAFIASHNHTGVCVFQDSPNKAAEIVVDQNKHASSWFDLSRATAGKWANKAYIIKTHVGKQGLDIAGGQATEGQKVLQYDLHGGDNQNWLIEPVEIVDPEVPANFTPFANTTYKIVSVLDKSKALSVDQGNKVVVHTFNNEPSQKFNIFLEHHKYGFTATHNHAGLSVNGDTKDNAAEIVAVPGKHHSNWFEIAVVTNGKWANRGYIIKTHAGNRALDIAGGQATEGQKVLQYDFHGNENQIWQIVATEQQGGFGFHWGSHFPQHASFHKHHHGHSHGHGHGHSGHH